MEFLFFKFSNKIFSKFHKIFSHISTLLVSLKFLIIKTFPNFLQIYLKNFYEVILIFIKFIDIFQTHSITFQCLADQFHFKVKITLGFENPEKLQSV